jgi:hypothetical protein
MNGEVEGLQMRLVLFDGVLSVAATFFSKAKFAVDDPPPSVTVSCETDKLPRAPKYCTLSRL